MAKGMQSRFRGCIFVIIEKIPVWHQLPYSRTEPIRAVVSIRL